MYHAAFHSIKSSFKMINLQKVFPLIFLVIALNASATPPLQDILTYEKTGGVDGWLDFPINDKLREISVRSFFSGHCSARGGPRAVWRIENSALWLVAFHNCSGDISLESIYGGDGKPIKATWISRTISMGKGRDLCSGDHGLNPGISEFTIYFEIAGGTLINVSEKSNATDPAIATVQDLMKLKYSREEAEKIVKDSSIGCLSQERQKFLRN